LPWNRYSEKKAKSRFVILSEAKDLVFFRFFGRFAPSELQMWVLFRNLHSSMGPLQKPNRVLLEKYKKILQIPANAI